MLKLDNPDNMELTSTSPLTGGQLDDLSSDFRRFETCHQYKDKTKLEQSLSLIANCLRGPLTGGALTLLTQMGSYRDVDLQEGALNILNTNILICC